MTGPVTKSASLGEWAIIIGLTAIAVAVTELVGVGQKWGTAIVYTIVVFSVVIATLRPAWGRRAFWQNLVPLFLLHVLVLLVIEQSLPLRSEGPRGLPLTAAGMAESVLIGGVLWKRSMGAKKAGK